jgi:transaldolase
MYDADIEAGIRAGLPIYKVYESLIFEDIRNACDILRPVYESSNGLDGYVSIEVPPTIADDTKQPLKKPDAITRNWSGKCDDQNSWHKAGCQQ